MSVEQKIEADSEADLANAQGWSFFPQLLRRNVLPVGLWLRPQMIFELVSDSSNNRTQWQCRQSLLD
jgi:hypothetical protein